jgi:predicted enzyme related to lactoylglutathione lyase
MTKILGLRTVIYYVPDLEQAKNWYSEAFETQPYFDEPYYVGYNIAGYELGLHPGNPTKTANNSICYWGVENITEYYQKLITLGAKELESPSNVGGQIMVASVMDPWGNAIGIIYNPEFSLGEK